MRPLCCFTYLPPEPGPHGQPLNSGLSGHSNSYMHLTFYCFSPQARSFILSTFCPTKLESTADCESTMNPPPSIANYQCFYSSIDSHYEYHQLL